MYVYMLCSCFAHVLLMLKMIINGLRYPKCLERPLANYESCELEIPYKVNGILHNVTNKHSVERFSRKVQKQLKIPSLVNVG